jgi:hypothetical protein
MADNDKIEIIFKQSAFKHGQTEDDIRWAFETFQYDEYITGSDNQFRLLGFNTKGNLIEILYNEVNDHRINVFHANPCPDNLLDLLKNRRR